jgi:regulator of sigma E protease
MGLGISLADDSPRVGAVSPGFPAEGKLQVGDRVLRVGVDPVQRFSQIRPAIVRQSPRGEPLVVEVERGGQRIVATLGLRRIQEDGRAAWILGISPDRRPTVQKYGPSEAAVVTVNEVRRQTADMLGFIARLVTGKASSRNLSGAIGIAQAANYEAQKGFSSLLWFMGALSLILCVMNLLPIPILDGGRMLYYLIELVSGRPVGQRAMEVGQIAGLAIVVGLIVLANYNDVVRNLAS